MGRHPVVQTSARVHLPGWAPLAVFCLSQLCMHHSCAILLYFIGTRCFLRLCLQLEGAVSSGERRLRQQGGEIKRLQVMQGDESAACLFCDQRTVVVSIMSNKQQKAQVMCVLEGGRQAAVIAEGFVQGKNVCARKPVAVKARMAQERCAWLGASTELTTQMSLKPIALMACGFEKPQI